MSHLPAAPEQQGTDEDHEDISKVLFSAKKKKEKKKRNLIMIKGHGSKPAWLPKTAEKLLGLPRPKSISPLVE